MLFSFLLFGFLNALTLRYIGDFIEVIDYSNIFALSYFQQLVDSVHHKLSGNMQLLVPVVLPFAVALIVGIFSVIVILLMHIIKNIFTNGKSTKALPDHNRVVKIKKLIEKANEFKNYYFDPFHWAIILGVHLFSVSFTSVSLVIKDPDVLHMVWLLAILCLIVTTIVSSLPFCVCLFITHNVDSSFYDYSKKIYQIKETLDKWWVETDPVEKAKREREKFLTAEKRPDPIPYIPNNIKTTTSTPEHGPLATATNCGMPPIDVSGM